MTDYPALIRDLKEYRRQFADRLEADLDPELARTLADTHMAILAVEAVMAEPAPMKTGPRIEFDENGWPIDG